MTILSVPLPKEVEEAIVFLINNGYAKNRAEAARKAIMKAREDEAVALVLQSEKEIEEGKILRGDPVELMEKI